MLPAGWVSHVVERLLLPLRKSHGLALTLLAAHAIALLALWLTPTPNTAAVAGTVVILASLVYSVRRHAFRTAKGAVIELELREDCSASARLRGEGLSEYRVGGSSFVSPILTVVNLRGGPGRRSRTALITAGSVGSELFRRLRVWLVWRCGPGTRVAPGVVDTGSSPASTDPERRA